jgi:hypothetical protein
VTGWVVASWVVVATGCSVGADARGSERLHAVAITRSANPALTPIRTFFAVVLSF